MPTLSRQLGDVTFPTHEEAVALARRRDAGDRAARDELITRNIPLAMRSAFAFARANPRFRDDLLGASLVGLVEAADGFDPGRDIRFSTYAKYWIRKAVLFWFADEATLIRVPRHVHQALARARRGLAPTRETSAEIVGAARRALAASAPGAGLGLGREVASAPADPGEDPDWLARAIDRLDPRESELIRLRFGLGGEGPLLQRDVAARVGRSRPWVCWAEPRALARLAAILEDDP